MTVLLALVFWGFSIGTSLLLVRFVQGDAWAVSPLAAFIGISTLFINIGFAVFFLRYAAEPWALSAIASVSLGLLTVAVTGALGVVALRLPASGLRDQRGRMEEDVSFPVAVSSTLILFVISLSYFVFLGYVPLFEGLKTLLSNGFVAGLVNSFRVGRDVYVNPEARYIPFQGFLELIRYFGLPIAAVWFVEFFRRHRMRVVSVSLLAVIALLLVLTGQRWPLMYMLATVLVYLSWTVEHGPGLPRAARWVVASGLLAGIVLSVLLGRRAAVGSGLFENVVLGVKDLGSRIVLGNSTVPFLSYSLFPSKEGWLWGGSWFQNLKAYLPGPLPSYPVTFYQLVTGDYRGFSAPPDFYTEAYINFGLVGVIVLSAIWGSALALLQLGLSKARRSLLEASICALLVTLVGFSAISGVSALLGGLIVSIFVWGVVRGQQLVAIAFRSGRGLARRRGEPRATGPEGR